MTLATAELEQRCQRDMDNNYHAGRDVRVLLRILGFY